MLVLLRLAQGLALGGEYGGAAIFVGEHSPQRRRGFFTSWIQMTAPLGLLMSLLVVLFFRHLVGEADFELYGWRFPFLVSFGLLAASVWLRLQLSESPAFRAMKAAGRGSRAPVSEAFGKWGNARIALVALFGGVAGQAVVWYTGQFYTLFFLTETLKVDATTANLLLAGALVIGAPFFVLFGWLSDRVGRKPLILGGCLLAALLYFPVFKALTVAANPALAAAQAGAPVKVIADPAQCSFQFDPVEAAEFIDLLRSGEKRPGQRGRELRQRTRALRRHGAHRRRQQGDRGLRRSELDKAELKLKRAAFDAEVKSAIEAAGYPLRADPAQINKPAVLALLTALVIMVAMSYGPIAAQLVELFPTRIRYTSLSVPYHIGNGWFGGFLAPLAFAMVAASGNIYFGLWYPVGIAIMTVVVGLFLIPETKDKNIYASD